MQLTFMPHQHEQVAAYPVHYWFNHGQSDGARKRAVDGITPLVQHA